MISGNIEKFISPIRQFTAKVELSCGGSTNATLTGNPIIITDAVDYAAPISIQLGGATTSDFAGIEVKRTGKNLLPNVSYSAQRNTAKLTYENNLLHIDGITEGVNVGVLCWKDSFVLPAGTYTMSATKLSGTKASENFYFGLCNNESGAWTLAIGTNGTSDVMRTFTLTTETQVAFRFIGMGSFDNISYQIQLEAGSVATEYEPYKPAQIAVANSEGIVEGITSLAPTTTLMAPDGVSISATYLKPIVGNGYTINHDDNLVSITVDRAGESKFFGFGVGQKVEVNIRDKDRTYDITNNHQLKAYIDEVDILPTFYVKDAKRNENTNDLTITAYDALEKANSHYTNELVIGENPSIRDYAEACALLLGLGIQAPYVEFDLVGQANIGGTETIRDLLNDIAEATQTFYFINQNNTLTFKRLDIARDPVYTIDKTQYFTLKAEAEKTLAAIVSATELGDNVEATAGEGEKQYIRDNAFWTLQENVDELVDNALNNVNNTTIIPFDCSWRGNYLVEIGDKIAITTKDDSEIITYLLNDKMTYNGGFSQHSQWSYNTGEQSFTNPSTLGEVIKQTYAKVDKTKKQIDLVASEESATRKQVSALQITTDSINASVGSITKQNTDLNDKVSELSKQVSMSMTEEQFNIKVESRLSEGVDKVKTTEKNFTFDDEGLSISSSENKLSTTITEDGMTVYNDYDEVLTANNEGVKATDLHARTYLIIGENSRFEDYDKDGEKRTACFWIGG